MLHLGIIGCGGVTEQRHLPALRRVAGVEVVALADVDSRKLERVANQFGVARRESYYLELIESEGVDAVAVCAPPQLHAEMAMAALKAGKHVFVEKPLALSVSECELLSEQANAHSELKVMVGFNLRWHGFVREAREIIGRGRLGEIKLVRTVFTSGARFREDSAGWRRSQKTGGGALFELGTHHFDLLRFLLASEADVVYATSGAEDDTATVLMTTDCGAQVVSAFSESTGENHSVEIYGTRGWLSISCYRADGLEQFRLKQYPGAIAPRLRKLARTFLELPRMMQQSMRGGGFVASYAEEWHHFVCAINDGLPLESNICDGLRALEIALAAQEASTTKRAVKVRNAKASVRLAAQ